MVRKFVKKPLPEPTTCFWCGETIELRHGLTCPSCASGLLYQGREYRG